MKTFDNNKMTHYAFQFWFSDHEHVRSPFPDYIQSELRVRATEQFQHWLNTLDLNASDEIDDQIIAEKFEQLLFESAIPLIKTEDERISILYPFLPRIGDLFRDENGNVSNVFDRFLRTSDEISYLYIKCERVDNKEKWETAFELTI